MKDFAMIGAAGFVAPRHLRAIRETGNQLVAAMDPSDSVGILDQYFPETSFFTELERFDRQLEKLNRRGNPVHYLSICSPNYLHDAHIRFGLRHGADVICEKPLVLNPWNIEALQQLQQETGKKVFNILQLRLHPSVIALKKKMDASPQTMHDIDLTYISARGKWYYASWKAELHKSGGIATNIGIHFFDMLLWIFGPLKENVVHIHTHDRAAGFLQLERARVKWFLSINHETIPEPAKEKHVFRSVIVDGEEIMLNDGFSDLHTISYRNILDNKGFALEEAIPSINLVHRVRTQSPVALTGDHHTLAALPLSKHPFDL